MGRGWKSFEVHVRESQDGHEWTVSTTMNVKDSLVRAQKKQKRERESWKESFHLLRECINYHKKNVGRNMNVKHHFGDDLK